MNPDPEETYFDPDEEEPCTLAPVRDESLNGWCDRWLAKQPTSATPERKPPTLRVLPRPEPRPTRLFTRRELCDTLTLAAVSPHGQRLNIGRGRRLLARLQVEEALREVKLPPPDSDEAVGTPRAVAQAVWKALFEAGLKPEHLHRTDRTALLTSLAVAHGWPKDTVALGVADLLKDTVLPAGMTPMEFARELARRQPGRVKVMPLGSPRLTALAQWIGDAFWHCEHLPPTEDGRSGEDGFVPAPYLSARAGAKLFGCRPVDAAFALRQLVAQGVLHLARPKTAKWAAHYSTDPLKAQDLRREYERRREEKQRREASPRRKQKPPRGRGVT